MIPKMPDRDLTTGELAIMLENVLAAIKDLKDSVATKEFVNAKFDSYNDRVARLEDDVKEMGKTSTAAHVKLDADSQARVDEAHTYTDKQVNVISSRLDALEAEQREQEKTLKAQRNQRAQGVTIAIIGSILSIVGSVVATAIIRGLFPQ